MATWTLAVRPPLTPKSVFWCFNDVTNVLCNNVEDIFIVIKTCFLVRLKIGRFLRGRQNTPKTSILGHFRGSEQKYSPRAVLPPKTAFLVVFCPYDADQVFRGGQKTALFWPFFWPLFDPQKWPQKRPFFRSTISSLHLSLACCVVTSLVTSIRFTNSLLQQELWKQPFSFTWAFLTSSRQHELWTLWRFASLIQTSHW